MHKHLQLAGKASLGSGNRTSIVGLPEGGGLAAAVAGVAEQGVLPSAAVSQDMMWQKRPVPKLIPKLTMFHGTSVPILIAYFLSPTEGHYLGQTWKFWARILRHTLVWRGFYCRDFYRAADGSFVPNAPMEPALPAAGTGGGERGGPAAQRQQQQQQHMQQPVQQQQQQVKCVWVQLEGRSGLMRCLYHMRLKTPREFEDTCNRISRIPGRSRAELMDRYKEWMPTTHRVEASIAGPDGQAAGSAVGMEAGATGGAGGGAGTGGYPGGHSRGAGDPVGGVGQLGRAGAVGGMAAHHGFFSRMEASDLEEHAGVPPLSYQHNSAPSRLHPGQFAGGGDAFTTYCTAQTQFSLPGISGNLPPNCPNYETR